MKNHETSAIDEILSQLGMEYECSDVGNMYRFIDQHGELVRYSAERRGWLEWDGFRWGSASYDKIFSRGLETVKAIYDEARNCDNKAGNERLGSWAKSSQSHRRISTMLNMAANHPEITVQISKYDQNPGILNCLNGLIDLRTGELLARDNKSQVTRLAPVKYDVNANCPVFIRFLHQIFDEDKDLMKWVQRAVGYSLTGLTTESTFFLAYGTGANGKTTLFETLLDILGDYGRTAEFDNFLATDRTNTRTMEGIARLKGIRFGVASETDSTKRFSEATIKRVTGGDTLIGTFLYGASFEFRPEFKLWMLANHNPIAKDGSHGFWRRVRVIPFNKQFTGDEIDQSLRSRLLAEQEGIMAWCGWRDRLV